MNTGETIYICPLCKQGFFREYMKFSYDCHGIPFRLICEDCYEEVMNTKGYDGEYYTELDENIEPDW